MSQVPSSISLTQALLFLATGTPPIPDAEFWAIGAPEMPADKKAYDAFILEARRGTLPLFGVLCCRELDYGRLPRRHLKHCELVRIPTEELMRDDIDLEAEVIKWDGFPSDVRQQLAGHRVGPYRFVAARAAEAELRALQLVCAEQRRCVPVPNYKYDPGEVTAEVLAIYLRDGFKTPKGWLLGKVQEGIAARLGEKATPERTTIQTQLAAIYRHPELRDIFLPAE